MKWGPPRSIRDCCTEVADWHFRYRRIIDAYRSKLLEVDERACMSVDIKVEDWGDGWVTDERPVDPNRLMTAREIADQFGLTVYNIRDWSRRHPDLVPKNIVEGKVLFRLGDVLRYRAQQTMNRSA
jgi:hypothetical protein